MKLNFWQWLGIALLLAGLAYWVYHNRPVEPGVAPATQPQEALSPAAER